MIPSHNKTKNKDDQVVAPCIPQYHGGDKRRSSNWQLTLIFDYIFFRKQINPDKTFPSLLRHNNISSIVYDCVSCSIPLGFIGVFTPILYFLSSKQLIPITIDHDSVCALAPAKQQLHLRQLGAPRAESSAWADS